jgi:hypothetical protein
METAMPGERHRELAGHSKPAFRSGWGYEFVLLAALLAVIAAKSFSIAEDSYFRERKGDFQILAGALERYKADTGHYPVSTGFSGLASTYGYSGPDWIPGLAPGYLPSLPSDPRRSDNPTRQYYYKSDGQDYKLIAHHVEDCPKARNDPAVHVDPVRDCYAYGHWTRNAATW